MSRSRGATRLQELEQRPNVDHLPDDVGGEWLEQATLRELQWALVRHGLL
jgi:phage terminase large subunit GpA-like protein